LFLSPVFSQQLLSNNEFVNGLAGWATSGSGDFEIIPGSDQHGSHVDFAIADGGNNPWDVKLYQEGISLQPGFEYVLEWGASRQSGTINVGVGLATAPYTDYMNDKITFTGDYVDHTVANGGAVKLHHCGSALTGLRVYIDLGGSNADARIAWASLSANAKPCGENTDAGSEQNVINTNPGTGPVSYYGELKKRGSQIVGARTNAPAQVRGMSFYWSIWGGENFYNAGAVNALVDQWKCEILRTAMSVEVNDGYVNNAAVQMYLVETVVDAAIAKGVYVIIDFHTHHAEDYKSNALTFFKAMAKKYGQYDNVIFEIYNEPLRIPWSTVKSYALPVIAAIREHSDNLIVVGTPSWSQDVDVAASNQINDPNIAYALHFYAGTHGDYLQDKARKAMARGAALMVTEWGTVNADGDGGVATASSNSWMAFMDQYKLSWANWSVQSISEGASIFVGGISTDGSNWNNTNYMTASGRYVYNKLNGYSNSAAWRKAIPAKVQNDVTNAPSEIHLISKNGGDIRYSLPMELLNGKSHEFRLFNISGSEIRSSVQNSNTSEFRFDATNLPVGVYLIHIKTETAILAKTIHLSD